MNSMKDKKPVSGWGGWCVGGGAGAATAGAGAAMMAAVALLLPLPAQSRVGVWRGLALFALGGAHFTCLFAAASALLRRSALAARLTQATLLDVANKAVSGVQALWSSAAGAAVCLHSCSRDAAATNHYLSDAYAWFGAAYFFYDIWSMYIVHVEMALEAAGGARVTSQTVDYEALGAGGGAPRAPRAPPLPSLASFLAHEPLMVAHHCFIGGFGFLVIVYLRGASGDCVFGFVYLMEVSTVFVSLRGALARAGRRGALYAANGAAMLATFALFRLAALPYALALHARARGLHYFEALWALPTGCKLSILLLMLPQVYWFYLMCRGALKLVASKEKGAAVQGAAAEGAGAAAGGDAGGARS